MVHLPPSFPRTQSLPSRRRRAAVPRLGLLAMLALALAAGGACGGGSEDQGGGPGASAGRRGGPPGGGFGAARGGPPASAAVPVEVVTVQQRELSAYLETTGVLEAEVAVDLVARTSGPITTIRTEETRSVRQGQLLATIDERELRARFEIARVARDEADRGYQRSQELHDSGLISQEDLELARNRSESAAAELRGAELALDYARVEAPFDGVVVTRYIKPAQTVSPGEALFHIVDLDPLLCPVQIPEGRLPDLKVGQGAYLTVEAWGDERFPAEVLRISPVVDAATGTVKVTLAVERRGQLAPGMFAAVFLELETRSDALVVPREALTLESLGDTLYVVEGGEARRRDVEVGVRQGDLLEIAAGVEVGEAVVVVGQDGLAEGTPVEVLVRDGESLAAASPPPTQGWQGQGGQGRPQGGPPGQARQRGQNGQRGQASPPGQAHQGPPVSSQAQAGEEPRRQRPAERNSAGDASPGASAPAGDPAEEAAARGAADPAGAQRGDETRGPGRRGPGAGPGAGPRGGPGARFGGPPGAGGPDPAARIEAMRQRLAAQGLSPAEIQQRLEEMTRQRLQDRGLSEEQIERRLEALRRQLSGDSGDGASRP